MKRILNWLKAKFSRHSTAEEADARHAPVGVDVELKGEGKEENNVEAASDQESIPDQYASDDSIMQPKSRDHDELSADTDESTGADPYNRN